MKGEGGGKDSAYLLLQSGRTHLKSLALDKRLAKVPHIGLIVLLLKVKEAVYPPLDSGMKRLGVT